MLHKSPKEKVAHDKGKELVLVFIYLLEIFWGYNYPIATIIVCLNIAFPVWRL